MSAQTRLTQPRRLNANGRPALALQALARLSQGLAANDTVSTAELQAYMGDTTSRNEFAERVMLSMLDNGLVLKPAPHGWRITATGTQMLLRLAGLVNDAGAAPPKAAPKPQEPAEPYVGQIVPAPRIQRMAGHYTADECNFKHVRPGGLDFRELPSRRGNMLVYRDGRTVPIDHGNQQPQRPRTPNPVPPPAPAPAAAAAVPQPKPRGRRRAA